MRLPLLLAVSAVAAFCAEQPDPLLIVQKALKLSDDAAPVARSYSLTHESVFKEVGPDGKVKRTETRTFEITPIGGQPHMRLVRRDGKPLPADEERKEREKFEAVSRERNAETPEQRKQRLDNFEKASAARNDLFHELPAAFTFHHAGSEAIDGTDAWIIEARPKPGYRGKTARTAILEHMTGKMWISKNYGNLIKVDAVTTAPVSFGWILAKLAPGTRFVFEQMRLPDGSWVMRRSHTNFDARIAFFKRIRGESEQIMSNYRR